MFRSISNSSNEDPQTLHLKDLTISTACFPSNAKISLSKVKPITLNIYCSVKILNSLSSIIRICASWHFSSYPMLSPLSTYFFLLLLKNKGTSYLLKLSSFGIYGIWIIFSLLLSTSIKSKKKKNFEPFLYSEII